MFGKALLMTTTVVLSACNSSTVSTPAPHDESHQSEEIVAPSLASLTQEQIDMLNKTPLPADRYPAPPEPHFGPAYGSISFTDTDPTSAIGGTLTMRPAVDDNGARINETDAGISQYMIHWGLEVGAPGTADDKGAGDLGGDCMGFRDTGHIVMMSADDAKDKDILRWDIPQGTIVPENAVYFVGHTLYGDIHNLGKCTQTPIDNRVD